MLDYSYFPKENNFGITQNRSNYEKYINVKLINELLELN